MSQPNKDLDTVLLRLNQLQTHVDARLTTQDQVIGEIKTSIVGNEMGTTGLAKRVANLEKNASSVNTWRTKVVAMATALGIGGGVLGTKISDLLGGHK